MTYTTRYHLAPDDVYCIFKKFQSNFNIIYTSHNGYGLIFINQQIIYPCKMLQRDVLSRLSESIQ
jgi:hypothetical protein